MNDTYYSVVLVALEIIFSVMFLAALKRAGLKRTILTVIGVIFACWLATVYIMLSRGFFSDTGVPQFSFTLAVVFPVVIGYLATRFYAPARAAVEALTTRDFLQLQYWRAVFGAMFFLTPALPMWFKCIGGLGDIAAGIGAFLALVFFRNHPGQEGQTIIRGNLVGIFDFIIVFALGIGVVLKDQSPDIMFDLIPLYVVPLFILLHVFSLQRLKKTTTP